MFQDIINKLLEMKANLNADKEVELNAFMNELEIKFAEREEKINKMLDDAGYVAPVEKVVEEEAQVVETTNDEDWR